MSNTGLQIMIPVLTGASSTILGSLILRRIGHDGQKKPDPGSQKYVYAISLLLGIAVLIAIRVTGFSLTQDDAPALQSIQSKPNSASVGDPITLTVELNKPAPPGGVAVHLTSSDPAVLTVDGDAMVSEGENMGTGYSKVVNLPNYRSPVKISATYNNTNANTLVNIVPASTGKTSNGLARPAPAMMNPTLRARVTPLETTRPTSVANALPPVQPKTIDPELVSRLEEAQAGLTGEKGYWANVRQHMPAGSSLRPEITSQMYAAESTAQRCTRAQQEANSTALSSCVDALNDHLNQLRIQH